MSNGAPPIEPMATDVGHDSGCMAFVAAGAVGLLILAAVEWAIVEAGVRVGAWMAGTAP